jgi:hypothetical protein
VEINVILIDFFSIMRYNTCERKEKRERETMNETMFYFEYEANNRIDEVERRDRLPLVPLFTGFRLDGLWQGLNEQLRSAVASLRAVFDGSGRPQEQCC